jgi:MYXO-CTERM domain-containing protein
MEMKSVFSKLASLGVLALGLALVPATLPAQNNNAAGTSGNQAATAPAPNQNGNAANTAGNGQNGNAANPNNPNPAAAPPAGTAATGNNTGDNGGGGGWGLWGLVGLLGLFGLARGRGRATYVEPRDRDINDRRVA